MEAPAPAPVKVVIIEYHHVRTDVSNFKSVVQSLTGKRSSSAADTSFRGEDAKRRRLEDESTFIQTSCCSATTTTPFKSSLSFKELDRLLKFDLPSDEDLAWIWDV